MTHNNSLTFFDQLATEICFEIFDYLSCNDILYTFFYFNQRFNSILLEHRQFLCNFQTPPTTNLNIWQNILPIIGPQIQCLIITTIDFSFSLDLFPNLKSIIISSPLPIYYEELTFILESKQFNKLNSFKIKSKIFYKEENLFRNIFQIENSLQTFECLSKLPSREINNLIINETIQSLSLQLTNLINVFHLLDYIPNLKYFNLFVSSSYFNNRSNQIIDLSKIKLKKFSLTLENENEYQKINEKNFFILTNFIKQFSSSLIYLSMNLNNIQTKEFQFNGITLKQQLLESMIQLKSFHLYAKFDEELIDIENILSTFKKQFWFDHNWTIGIHEKYLYTLPFHFDRIDDFIGFDHIESSNSKILNSPSTWYHVKSIDFSKYFNLNLIKQIKIKMPNLISINLNNKLMNDLYTNEYETTLDSITTVYCEGEFIKNMKQRLTYILPNVKNLVLSYNHQSTEHSSNRIVFLQKTDAYFRGDRITTDYVYFSKVQNVEIKLVLKDLDYIYKHVLRLAKEILEMFKNLKNFIFEFYQINLYSGNVPFTDLNKMITLLNMDKISRKYQIKYSYNRIQFVKKEQSNNYSVYLN